jgi:plastocyanin
MKLATLLLTSAVLVGIAGWAGRAVSSAQGPQAPPNQQVRIDNFSFTPQQLTITQGTTVVWTNDDDVPHTVAGTHQEFRSKALDTGDQFSFTFTKPGRYEYFCSVHPMMTGKIVVK